MWTPVLDLGLGLDPVTRSIVMAVLGVSYWIGGMLVAYYAWKKWMYEGKGSEVENADGSVDSDGEGSGTR